MLQIRTTLLLELLILIAISSGQSVDYASQLYLDLTADEPPDGRPRYVKEVIPPVGPCPNNAVKCPFIIQSRLFLIRIHDIIEASETLITSVRLQLGWNDTRLAWDPQRYGGLTTLIMPGDALWRPDLQLANSIDDNYVLAKDEMFNFKIYNNGEVWWHPTAKVMTRCALDLTYYPWDYQRCALIIESVIYLIEDLLLMSRSGKTGPDSVPTSMFAPNDVWTLVNASGYPVIYRTSKTTAFSRMNFWMVLKRQPSYVQQTFLLPIALLSVLQLLTLIIPLDMVDRVAQATVVLLAVAVYQGTVTQSLPETSDRSRVAAYLNMVMAMSVCSVAICVITIALVEPDHSVDSIFKFISKRLKKKNTVEHLKPPPRSAKSRAAEMVDAKSMAVSDNDEEGNGGQPQKSETALFVAAFINWSAFAVFLFLVVVYPCDAFATISNMEPPSIPEIPANGTSSQYFPEL